MDKMKEQVEEKEMERTRLRTVAGIIAQGAIRLSKKKRTERISLMPKNSQRVKKG